MAASVNAAAGVTIMGMGAMNAVSNNLMMEAGGTIPLRMIDFTIARTPFVVIAIAYMVFIGYKLLPNLPESHFADQQVARAEDALSLGKGKKAIAAFITIAVIVCLFLTDFLSIPAWITACVGSCLYVVFGVLKPQEAYRSIHMPTIFLFAGILTITAAMSASGADKFVGQVLTGALGGQTNPYIALLVVCLTVLIMTQFMSNMIIVVFSGIAAMVFVQLGFDPRAAVMAIQICGSASILTPMASPVQAMIMAPGGYELKDYIKSGLPLCVITVIAAVFFMPMLFPFFAK
jgi:di/tricarboxylate transporter